MRVALFTNTYLPSVNGVANCTHLYRRGLTELGHEVFIFAPEPLGEDPFTQDPQVLRYPAVRVPGEVDYTLALPPLFAPRTQALLRRLSADVVHTQHPVWVGSWGQAFALRRGLPLVSTAHTQYDIFAARVPWLRSKLAATIRRHVVRYYNRCHVVTTPVPWVHQWLREEGVTAAIEIVSNPVDLSGLNGGRREESRRRLGFAEEDIVVGYLGRLSPEKNLSAVVEAAGRLAQEWPRLRFLVVGDGPALREVRRLTRARGLEGRAVFTGAVPHERVGDYHAAMDLFLTGSISETQPLAYTEAMYVGTPVIALATPGACDMIRHEVNGLLVEPQAGGMGLAEAARRVLRDGRLREQVVRGGREFARRCDYTTIAHRLVQVYQQATQLRQSQHLGVGPPPQH